MRPSLNQRFLKLIRELEPVEAQNRLLRVADRELAIAMLYMEERERQELFAFLSPAKAKRVKEEYGFAERRAVRYDQYRVVIEGVITQLSRSGAGAPMRSYLRPRRKRGR